MSTFAINTLGCKVNQYESQQIRELLERLGLNPAQLDSSPDLVVVNTCCVTHIASAKSRQRIRKAQKQFPNATIVVAGCLPVGQPGELTNIVDSDTNSFGNIHIVRQKKMVAETLNTLLRNGDVKTIPENTIKTSKNSDFKNKKDSSQIQPTQELSPLTSYQGRGRAFLKIQDGCDGYCSYCIIPKIRKNVCNKNVKTVLTEVKNLVGAGHKEIVLTGVFLGAYGQKTVRRRNWEADKKDGLAKLLDKIAQVSGLARVRLSSLEPGDVTEKLLDVFCGHRNIMPHLHLPLQSGSERILKKMGRQYTAGDFAQVVDTIRDRLDRPAITADIIVGFPGETEDDFERTVDMVRSVEFAKVHVFSYSARENTAAAKMQPVVKSEVIKERSKRLREIDSQLRQRFYDQFVGQEVGIIVEEIGKNGTVRGRCERYFMVEMEVNEEVEKGDLVFGTVREN